MNSGKGKENPRESLQKEVLLFISDKGIRDLVFQGGTSLRIFYGIYGHSDDLDFVYGDRDVDLFQSLEGLPEYLNERFENYSFEVMAQKRNKDFQRAVLNSRTTYINLRINIEKFSVPSYIHSLKSLNHNNKEGEIYVEEPQEILADKIVAIASRPWVKGRDIIDIYYLRKNLKLPLDEKVLEILYRKANDYGHDSQKFNDELAKKAEYIDKARKDVKVELLREIDNYVDGRYLKQMKENSDELLEVTLRMLSDSKEKWNGSGAE